MGSNYYPKEQLGNVAVIIMGQSPPGSTYNEDGNGLPFFQGVRDFNYRHPSVRVFCSAPSRVARPGDILLSVRAPIGRVNIADRVCSIGRGLSVVRAKSDLDQRFIEFVLRLLEPSWQRVEGGGSVFGNATKNDLVSLPIPWPKPVERQAIAHILGSLDDKIELNRRMNQMLEATARAIFKSWFVDFLPVRAKMAAKANDPMLPACASHADRLLPQAEPGMWFVYAIECEDGSLYIGQTEDLRQRWLQHVSGKGGRWTKTHPPLRVAYWEKQPSREEAVEREKWLKTGFGRKWLKKEVAANARTQTGDPVRAKADLPAASPAAQAGGRPTGLPDDIAALFPDSFENSEMGEIPKGWKVKTIGDVAEFAYGKALKASDRKPGDVPVFGSNGQVGLHNEALVKGPGIVIGRKGNPGIVTWSYEDFFPIDTTFYVKRTGVVPSLNYLFYALKDQDLQSLSADSAVPGLNRNLAYMSKFLVPHENALTAFDGQVDPFFQKVYENEKESKTLASLRDNLLPKLISGELRVPDAEKFIEEAGV